MILLEKLTESTCQLMRKWRNHNRVFFVDRRIITHNEQEKWFKKYLSNERLWLFIVYLREIPIGSIGFSIVDKDTAQVELLMLGDKERAEKGYMTEALQKMLTMFSFKKWQLYVLKENKIAKKFYEKNGFAVDKEEDGCYIMIKCI